MTPAAKASSYESSDIENLHPRDQTRLRPSTTVGGTGSSALIHLVDEILANSADEALVGYARNVWVAVHKDSSVTVRDDGRGVPLGKTKIATSGKIIPTPQAVYTEVNTGGKYRTEGGYSSSGGMNGVGAKAVCYLSRYLSCDIRRDGQRYTQVYRNGPYGTPADKLTIEEPKIVPFKGDTGTSVTFLYDDSIFDTDVEIDGERVARRCYNLSRLVVGLSLHFVDERTGEGQTFISKNGLADFIVDLNADEEALFRDVIALTSERATEDANHRPVKIGVDVAFQPAATESTEERGSCFTNLINQPDGGTHLLGFRKGLTRALNGYFRKSGLARSGDAGFENSDVMSGLAFTLSIRTDVNALQFESQTKKQLNSTWVDGAVAGIVDEKTTEWLTDHPNQAKAWFAYLSEVRKSREAMLAERKAVKAKVGAQGGLDPLLSKITRETGKDPIRNEIYFVEGDSAGGSAKQARDRITQAILPFKGKCKNVAPSSAKKRHEARRAALEDPDIRRIASALECGLGQNFDIGRLRYNRVIFMADADEDGSHINALWLTALWYMFPEILSGSPVCRLHGEGERCRGHVYTAVPPLFSVYDRKTKKRAYYYNTRDLNAALKGRVRDSYTLNRFKGLGEMDPQPLRDTAMNPMTRRIRHITVSDTVEARQIIEDLMGKGNAAKRRAFMDEHCRGKNTREAVELV